MSDKRFYTVTYITGAVACVVWAWVLTWVINAGLTPDQQSPYAVAMVITWAIVYLVAVMGTIVIALHLFGGSKPRR